MNARILPPKINIGDKIGIIAPSMSLSDCQIKTINRGYKYLESKGFQIIEGKSCRLKVGHTAGNISKRVEDIHTFFSDKNIKCIMAFWGGYNSNQLLDYLDYNLIKTNPKIFIGYSDVTALTIAITQKTNLITFFGPACISFSKPEPFEYTWDYFENICINPSDKLEIYPAKYFADDAYYLRKDNDHRIIKKNKGFKVFREGNAKGKIIAGNLQTFLILYGTPYFPELKGSILFLEEDEESNTAMIDRLLVQCRQMKIFENINGLIFGRFMSQTGFNKNDTFEDILREQFKKFDFPIMYNIDFGHSDPLITIPNGGNCRINTKEKQIVFEKAVS